MKNFCFVIVFTTDLLKIVCESTAMSCVCYDTDVCGEPGRSQSDHQKQHETVSGVGDHEEGRFPVQRRQRRFDVLERQVDAQTTPGDDEEHLDLVGGVDSGDGVVQMAVRDGQGTYSL